MKPDLRHIALRAGKLAELIFFPSFCRVCDSLLLFSGERVVCRRCLSGLSGRRSGFCLVCGRFFDGAGEPHICGNCLNAPPPFSRHRSCSVYLGTAKDIILLFKFRNYAVLGEALARFMERTLGRDEDLWWGVDALVPVPLHPRRLRRRGFNQAAVLARHMGRFRGLDIIEGVLIRHESRAPQITLSAAERRMNVQGAFRVKHPERINGKVVMLVDDVFTTGATIEACSRELLSAGAAEVRAITVAQA